MKTRKDWTNSLYNPIFILCLIWYYVNIKLYLDKSFSIDISQIV